MNWQYLIIAIIFMVALIYLWNRVIMPFTRKNKDCGSGCGCGIDVDKLEEKRRN